MFSSASAGYQRTNSSKRAVPITRKEEADLQDAGAPKRRPKNAAVNTFRRPADRVKHHPQIRWRRPDHQSVQNKQQGTSWGGSQTGSR